LYYSIVNKEVSVNNSSTYEGLRQRLADRVSTNTSYGTIIVLGGGSTVTFTEIRITSGIRNTRYKDTKRKPMRRKTSLNNHA